MHAMMSYVNKVAQYLQEHLDGEVTDQLDIRRYFSTDASILSMTPSVVVYPRHEDDIRKIARFSWQLAERNQSLPITVRGGGTDTSGAAIGSGVILATTRHLNQLIDLDTKQHQVTVQPGLTYASLQQILETHGFGLPIRPDSATAATIGGGIANNSIGSQSVKYGSTQDYVKSLRVVLANGEVIETGPLGKRELSHKLGLDSFEGQLYRNLDGLLEESAQVISQAQAKLKAQHNSVGYNLFDVKQNGIFDLTPLFVGAQGSLGIITEATLHLEAHNPNKALSLASLDSIESLRELLPKLLELNPSLLEMINREALQLVHQINPSYLKDFRNLSGSAVHLFIEFDNFKESDQERLIKQAKKLIEKNGGVFKSGNKEETLRQIHSLQHAVQILLSQPLGQKRTVPILDNISLPTDQLVDFIDLATNLYQSTELIPAMWGPIGSGVIRMQPYLNIGEIGDRQKLFKLSENLFNAVIQMGGSPAAGSGDGRVRTQHTRAMLGDDYFELMLKVKQLFDPRGCLNPGVKTLAADEMRSLIRSEYSGFNLLD